MKQRFISLVLILASVLTFSMGIIIINKDVLDRSNNIAVISDLHIVSDSYFTSSQSFDYYKSQDKLLHLSEAILKTMADEVISHKKIKTVLIPGDLTENGDRVSHQAVATALKKFTDAGIKVFVINGNHDNAKTSGATDRIYADEFAEIYKEYGYSQALVRHDNSLSYVADISKDMRLIAIDNDDYYNRQTATHKQEVDYELIAWVITQLNQCKKDNKTPIAMAHKPFVNHLGLIGHLINRAKFSMEFTELANVLADHGCQYVFTGHMHGQDIDYFTSSANNRFLDIQTSSSVYYPNAYRIISFTKDKAKITSKTIDRLNLDYTSSYLSIQEQQLLNSDFSKYSYQHFCNSIDMIIQNNLSPDGVMTLLGLSSEHRAIADLIVNDIVRTFLDMPIYSHGTELSFNKIITMHNAPPLPPSEYHYFTDLVTFFVGKTNLGDEKIELDSVELQLLKASLMVFIDLVQQNSTAIATLYPDLPQLNIDTDRLFTSGQLELVDSNLLSLISIVVRDSLPGFLQNLNITIDTLKTPIIENFLNATIDNLGTELIKYLGDDYLDLENFIDEFLFHQLLKNTLIDNYPGDNNITIQRESLEPIT